MLELKANGSAFIYVPKNVVELLSSKVIFSAFTVFNIYCKK